MDEELLLRIEYLVAENRILHDQLKGRVMLSDVERQTLAEIGKKLGKQALEEIANIVKTEALSRMILFGERSLRHALSEYSAHHHTERPHQGKRNVILFPSAQTAPTSDAPSACRERLGGLLKYDHRKAA